MMQRMLTVEWQQMLSGISEDNPLPKIKKLSQVTKTAPERQILLPVRSLRMLDGRMPGPKRKSWYFEIKEQDGEIVATTSWPNTNVPYTKRIYFRREHIADSFFDLLENKNACLVKLPPAQYYRVELYASGCGLRRISTQIFACAIPVVSVDSLRLFAAMIRENKKIMREVAFPKMYEMIEHNTRQKTIKKEDLELVAALNPDLADAFDEVFKLIGGDDYLS